MALFIVNPQSVNNRDTPGQKAMMPGKNPRDQASHYSRYAGTSTCRGGDGPQRHAVVCLETQYIILRACYELRTRLAALCSMRIAKTTQCSKTTSKRMEPATFKVMPKRGIVERSMAWLEKHRSLWKNWERRRNTRVQCMRLAFRTLLLK